MEHWVDEVLPEAIKAVSEHAGGRPVHVIGWSLGGIFALLTAADQPALPIASLTVVGSPVDVRKVPLVAPVRPLLNLTEGRGLHHPRLPGARRRPDAAREVGLPARQRRRRWSPSRSPWLTHLDDADYLAQIEAVDRFTANMIAYPGRSFGQLYHRMIKGNALVEGLHDLRRPHHRARPRSPPRCWSSAARPTASRRSGRSGRSWPLLTGSAEVRFEIVPGGHLGMLTGRAARDSTWQVMDEWIEQWSNAAPPETPSPRRRRPEEGSPEGGSEEDGGEEDDPREGDREEGDREKPTWPRGHRRQPRAPLRLGRLPIARVADVAVTCAPTGALPRSVRIGYGSGSVATGAFGTVPGPDAPALPHRRARHRRALGRPDRLPAQGLGRACSTRSPDASPTAPSTRPARVARGCCAPAIMLAGAFALIFAAPDLGSQGLEAAWVLVFFVLAASAYAFFQVPVRRDAGRDHLELPRAHAPDDGPRGDPRLHDHAGRRDRAGDPRRRRRSGRLPRDGRRDGADHRRRRRQCVRRHAPRADRCRRPPAPARCASSSGSWRPPATSGCC